MGMGVVKKKFWREEPAVVRNLTAGDDVPPSY